MNDTEASYTKLAIKINEEFGPVEPVTRMHVYAWDTRQTRNALGQPFPAHVRTRKGVEGQRKPRRLFNVAEVVTWYAGGLNDAARRSVADNARRREYAQAQ